MKTNSFVFERIEKKFLVNKETYLKFLKNIEPYVNKDKHDRYTLSNIYFDTNDFYLINRSLEKPLFKEKLRIRSYGNPSENDDVFLEIKRKYKKVGYKRRITLSYEEAKDFILAGRYPKNDNQILREINYFLHCYKDLSPKCYLAYDREAYYGKDNKDLRITIDHNIRYRFDNLTLSSDENTKKLLDDNTFLIEIKAHGGYPFWLINILSQNKIYTRSFSKYGEIYKKEGKKLCSTIS